MAQIALLHRGLMNTMLLYMIAMAVWGIVNYARQQPVTGAYSGALVIAEMLVVAEALLGVGLLLYGARPARSGIHILYGIVAVICLPGAFAYTRGRDSRWEGLVYATVCLFLAGIAIRALQTGGG